jgi:hypothetical protein
MGHTREGVPRGLASDPFFRVPLPLTIGLEIRLRREELYPEKIGLSLFVNTFPSLPPLLSREARKCVHRQPWLLEGAKPRCRHLIAKMNVTRLRNIYVLKNATKNLFFSFLIGRPRAYVLQK